MDDAMFKTISEGYDNALQMLYRLRQLGEDKERTGSFVMDEADMLAADAEPESDRSLEDLVRVPYSSMSNREIEKVIDYKANLRAYTLYLNLLKMERPTELKTFEQISEIRKSDLGNDPIATYTEV